MSVSQDHGRCDLALVFDSGFGCGGAERVAVQLLRHWSTEGRKVALITMRGAEADFYAVPPEVTRIVTGGIGRSANYVTGLAHNLFRMRRLRRALRRSGAPVVLAFQTRTNVRATFAALGLGKRIVLSERSDPQRQKFAWPWRVLRWCLYRFADVVTANSRNALGHLSGIVPKHKLVFTPNPLELPDVLAVPSSARTILTVGSLKWHKAQGLLLESYSRLVCPRSDWKVVLVGDGPERERLEQLVLRLGVRTNVLFTGAVADPSLHYREAAIFAFPSLFEGMPNALLEAMSYGLPCVVSDALVDALDYLQDGVNALFFRAEDANDLASKLSRLIEDEALRDRLGAAARATMIRLFADGRQLAIWDQILWPDVSRE